MKIVNRMVLAAFLVALMTGCDAFHTLTKKKLKTAQGRPYELIVVCAQREWTGEVGDTLRAILTAPVPYLNQTEPLFDVMRVREQDFSNMIADHRNVLKVVEVPSLDKTSVAVQYNVTSEPQIVLTLQGPDDKSIVEYLSKNRQSLVQALESAERDRAVKNAEAFDNPAVQSAVQRTFGVEMTVPKGYTLAAEQPDFVWARYEYPTASQGFFIYSYPYEGPRSLSEAALLEARNRFAARIPGPSEGSYMTTSEVMPPDYRMFRLEGRLWCELRGFWDVHGDFMGGPFVSYSTVDTATNRVFTLDCYVYSPKLHKRNFMRGVEHLLYMVHFPEQK
ncbi:DUF4837 family protein [Alistipes sp.]|uniref:DUF4837 family protein n=1 Tax=Alistipes sp. TaxID=1872444 RepID=UPI003AF1B64E